MALGIIGLLVVSGVSAFGFFGEVSEEQRAEMKANHEAVRAAIEDNDYATWEGLMQEKLAQVEDMIAEENFQKMVERHESMEEFKEAVQELKDSGDFSREAMKELAEEYGIEKPGKEPGFGKGMKQGMKAGLRMGHELGNRDCPYANTK